MKLKRMLTLGVAAAALFALSHAGVALTQSSQTGSQGGAGSGNPGTEGQGGSEATLEIAPQPGVSGPKPGVEEIPSSRNFNPGESNTSVAPSFRPNTEEGTGNVGESNRPHPQPYLGITVQYATKCYLGGEEHGLEVLTIDPNSPAAQAGLRGRSGMTAIGAAVSTLTGILPGGAVLANKALSSSGAMGHEGDLIVAVDDRRVRDQSDLGNAMSRLKPGDTMYLTVIRPQGNSHTTLKIAVRVGAVTVPFANGGGPATSTNFAIPFRVR